MQRREAVRGLGGLVAAVALGESRVGLPELATRALPASGFPRTSDFMIPSGTTYLNAAYTHPIPRVSLEAARRAAEGRCGVRPPAPTSPRAQFAELIHGRPEEIAYVSCTSAGETWSCRRSSWTASSKETS